MAKPTKGIYNLEQYDFYYDTVKNVSEVGEHLRTKKTGIRLISTQATELNRHFINTGLKYELQVEEVEVIDDTPSEKELLIERYKELAKVDTVNKNWGVTKLTAEIKLLDS